jgi:endonuclease/exonuclease/phosphatase (EEP) superfamily protein YafD
MCGGIESAMRPMLGEDNMLDRHTGPPLSALLVSGLVSLSVFLSLSGLLAPLLPPAELTNNLRPMLLLASLVILPIAFWFQTTAQLWLCLVAVVVNIAFCLPPILIREPMAVDANRSVLKIVSFNMQFSEQTEDKLVAFLKEANPDVVLLQEILPQQAQRLFDRLHESNPSQVSCPKGSGCILGLLAKLPMASYGYQGRTEVVPPEVWADLSQPNGPPLRVIGLHMAFPLTPYRQSRHVDALMKQRQDLHQPVIISGDFNASPWSWLLIKLAWQGGLSRLGLFEATWPSDMGPWIAPFLLVDNMFVSPDIRSRSFVVGPDLGSDHRPIVVILQLP